MLEFFRKHQKYIYFIVTVAIVISFSFFGTYGAIEKNPIRDQVVFTAVDGTSIRHNELEEMVVFISTDNQDKLLFRQWGPNFLNDGVIQKDLLAVGLAQILASQYPVDLNQDLQSRIDREKNYKLYNHPQAKFITTENAWSYFAPNLKESYNQFLLANSLSDPDAFDARVQLYLSQKEFPASYLSNALNYLERQQNGVRHDANLDRIDLSLFGHHTVVDWFGPHFVRLSAQFIINAAKVAEKKGYYVSKDEALAEILRNAQLSYQQNLQNPRLGVANSTEYYNEQLRLMGMDQNIAVKVWQQVMLFRRLFSDVGNSVLTDALPYQRFSSYAKESLQGTSYALPKELQLNNFRSLQKFETYLNAVSKRSDDETLVLPKALLSVSEVAKRNPQLIQKRYTLEIAEANKDALQAKVSLRDTWNWEVQDKNWETVKTRFPQLALKKGDTQDERFAALDSLEDSVRGQVDRYSREALVQEHPEWLKEALDKARERTLPVGLSSKETNSVFAGLENGDELIVKLDNAPLKSDPAAAPLIFTADDRHYYRIFVIDRAPNEEILTFSEASRAGILDDMVDRDLKVHYIKIRDSNTAAYQNADQTWKSLEQVEDQVAENKYAKVLKAIEADYVKRADSSESDQKSKMSPDALASLRLYAYMNQAKENLQKDAQTTSPVAQWELVKEEKVLDRTSRGVDQEMFALGADKWSKVDTLPNGDLSFFYVKQVGGKADDVINTALVKKVEAAHQLLSDEAQRHYMGSLLGEIKVKGAISLAYMNRTPDDQGAGTGVDPDVESDAGSN